MKTIQWFATKSCSNQLVQLQRLAGVLNFCMCHVKLLLFLDKDNKCGDAHAGLHLLLRARRN